MHRTSQRQNAKKKTASLKHSQSLLSTSSLPIHCKRSSSSSHFPSQRFQSSSYTSSFILPTSQQHNKLKKKSRFRISTSSHQTFFSRIAKAFKNSSPVPTKRNVDDDIHLIPFSDQIVTLPNQDDLLEHVTQLRLAQEEDYLVSQIATYLPPSHEYAPFLLPNESPSSFVDYINLPTTSIGGSSLARNALSITKNASTSPNSLQSTQNTLSEAIRADSTTHSSTSPSSSSSSASSPSSPSTKADLDIFNQHFSFFWNFKSGTVPQLTPYTLSFTHKGKYTFNYPPNTTKLTVKYMPQEYLPNRPQLYTQYPSFRNTWINYPYITIPQVTIGEYFGQSPTNSASGVEANLIYSRGEIPLDSIKKLVKNEKKEFLPINEVISKEDFETNCNLLLSSLSSGQTVKRSTKHAYTHESEQILFPRSETRQFGHGKENSFQHLATNPLLQTKVLPSGQTPDLFPTFPSLPFTPSSQHLPQAKTNTTKKGIPDLDGMQVEVSPTINPKSTSYFDTLHSATPLQDPTQPHPQTNPDTPYVDPFHPIYQPFRPYDPNNPGSTILPSENEKTATNMMTTSTHHKQFTLQQYRLEILPKLFKTQQYAPVLSDHSIQDLIRTPTANIQALRIHKDDILAMYTAQFSGEYQDIFSPLSPFFNSNKARQQHYLLPSDLLNSTILSHITQNTFQMDHFMPPQLLDFIGPQHCDNYQKHFENLWATVGTKSNSLLRYSLLFQLFNTQHPYKHSVASSLFQQLRSYSYQHFNPVFFDIFHGNEHHLNPKKASTKRTQSQTPTARAASEYIDLELHLFSNTTVRHDPYLQTGWYKNMSHKLQTTEAFLHEFNDIPITTLQLVSSLFPPTSQDNSTPLRAQSLLQKRQNPKHLLTLADLTRHPKHPSIVHGALVNPTSKMLYTTFSATFGSPYDPHFLGYDGFTSQLMLYEMLRSGIGYSGAKWLASDEITNTALPIHVPYKENFWEPTPM